MKLKFAESRLSDESFSDSFTLYSLFKTSWKYPTITKLYYTFSLNEWLTEALNVNVLRYRNPSGII